MVDLAGRFTVIGMDQRNAGNSRGTVTSTHGWHTYASDHLALMDHLGHRRFHVMGGWSIPITVNRPARSTMGFIHGGGAAGLLGLWRQNSSWERRPPRREE